MAQLLKLPHSRLTSSCDFTFFRCFFFIWMISTTSNQFLYRYLLHHLSIIILLLFFIRISKISRSSTDSLFLLLRMLVVLLYTLNLWNVSVWGIFLGIYFSCVKNQIKYFGPSSALEGLFLRVSFVIWSVNWQNCLSQLKWFYFLQFLCRMNSCP